MSQVGMEQWEIKIIKNNETYTFKIYICRADLSIKIPNEFLSNGIFLFLFQVKEQGTLKIIYTNWLNHYNLNVLIQTYPDQTLWYYLVS